MPNRPLVRDIRVPEPLRELPFWCAWKYESQGSETKQRKVPYYPAGGRRCGKQGSPEDLAKLTTFAVARDQAAKRGMSGIGFAPTRGAGIVALDFDNCVVDGAVDPAVVDLVRGTYAEYSPSGKGVRAFFLGDLGNHKSPTTADQFGAEVFSTSGFVTVTGNMLPFVDVLGHEDTVARVTPEVEAFCRQRFGTAAPQAADPDDFMAGYEPKLGLTEEEARELLEKLDPDMGRESWIRVGMAAHHEFDGGEEGFQLWDDWSSAGSKYPGEEALRQQWDSFTRRTGPGRRQITMATVKMLVRDLELTSSTPASEQWERPIPLPDTSSPVPQLQSEMLPTELQPWLVDIAERMSIPLDFVGVSAMVMLAGLIGRRVLVRPEQHTTWSEAANLWGAIIAPPGAMKTPALGEVFAPLRELEAEALAQNAQDRAEHQAALAFHKVASGSAETQVRDLLKRGENQAAEQALMAVAREPQKPAEKRLYVVDATVEKLGEICAANPNGILFHRDELLTLFTDLDREEKAAARGFMMTGWNGQQPYSFDRITRGSLHIPAVNLSLIGTTQPERMKEFLRQSRVKNNDGLSQRLQLMCWPDAVTAWVPADRPPDVDAQLAARACCRRLANLDPVAIGTQMSQGHEAGQPPFLRLSDDARCLFVVWRTGWEAMLRDGSLPPTLEAHFAKYRGLVPRLALILHLASEGKGAIPATSMQSALEWARYLEAHARRVYASLDAEMVDAARLVWRKVENGELRDGFTTRDIKQKGWSGLQNDKRVEEAIRTLVEHNWLRAEKLTTGGRGKVVHTINPMAIG